MAPLHVTDIELVIDVGEGGEVAATEVVVGEGVARLVVDVVCALARLALTELADNDDSTLSTELVAVKEPVVMCGVVPARDIVGVVERPLALLKIELTELVEAAGVTLERLEVDVGAVPGMRE